MKRLLLFVILSLGGVSVVSGQCSNGLIWRKATDTLVYPSGIKTAKSDSSLLNGYYSIRCFYQKSDGIRMYSGYKLVCVYNGHYTDDMTTLGVFFDKKCRRIRGVQKYAFKVWAD